MRHRFASIGFREGIALAALALIGLAAPAGWAVSESEPAQEATAAAETESPAPTGEVARSAFTSEIVDREPVDQIDSLANDVTRIYYFTELRDLSGQTVVHRWEYDGEVKAEVPFEVGAPRWRASSSKNLDPGWLGEWTVSVVDGKGNTLSVEHFRYTGATAEAAPTAPEAAPASPAAP
jgi:hypothetical protein